jgi:regulator of sigma E protease
MVTTVLATLFVLGIMVFVHELGHFYVAKKVGIRVLKFSLGFGPKLFGFKKGDTQYLISALPLGGYVKLDGEDAFEEGYVPKPGDYMAAPWWGRVLMALAGPMANLVTAFLLLALVGVIGVRLPDFASLVGSVEKGSLAEKAGIKTGDHIVSLQGVPVRTWRQLEVALTHDGKSATPESLDLVLSRSGAELTAMVPYDGMQELFDAMGPAIEPALGEVMPGAPAYQAGMQQGDLVLSIDGKAVATWDEMRTIIYASPEKAINLRIKRGYDTLSMTVTPMPQQLPGQGTVGVIGISPPSYDSYLIRWPVHQAVILGAANTVSATVRTYEFLAQLATRPRAASQQLGGFVMIGQMAGQSAKKGLSDLLQLMAVLSVSLFVLNLLPIPVLDGGVIFFSILEGIRKKPLPVKVQVVIQQIGIAILIMLMLFTILNDGMKIFSRHSAAKKNSQQIEQAK